MNSKKSELTAMPLALALAASLQLEPISETLVHPDRNSVAVLSERIAAVGSSLFQGHLGSEQTAQWYNWSNWPNCFLGTWRKC